MRKNPKKYSEDFKEGLATIQKVSEIRPIEGADNIELVFLENMGWQVVCKKGDVEVGQSCIYVEIDSICPAKPQYEFLRERDYRVKTIRLRKQLSQGLIVPITPEGVGVDEYIALTKKELPVGTCVTQIMGIKKYLKPEERDYTSKAKFKKPLTWYQRIYWTVLGWFGVKRKKDQKGRFLFPNFIPKTDEERIQNCPKLIDRNLDTIIYVSEKLDGQSFSGYKNNDHIGFCSRNWELGKDTDNTWAEIFKKHNIESILKAENKNIVIQGEVIGEGIQSNYYKIQGIDLYVFNVYDTDKKCYYSFNELVDFCKRNNLKMVPLVKSGITLQQLLDQCPAAEKNVDRLLAWVDKAKSAINPTKIVEGYVIRSEDALAMKDDIRDSRSGQFSVKVISNKFLLDKGE